MSRYWCWSLNCLYPTPNIYQKITTKPNTHTQRAAIKFRVFGQQTTSMHKCIEAHATIACKYTKPKRTAFFCSVSLSLSFSFHFCFLLLCALFHWNERWPNVSVNLIKLIEYAYSTPRTITRRRAAFTRWLEKWLKMRKCSLHVIQTMRTLWNVYSVAVSLDPWTRHKYSFLKATTTKSRNKFAFASCKIWIVHW